MPAAAPAGPRISSASASRCAAVRETAKTAPPSAAIRRAADAAMPVDPVTSTDRPANRPASSRRDRLARPDRLHQRPPARGVRLRDRALPMPTATAPESRYRRAFVASTPPVAISSTSGIGPRSSRANDGPTADAGNSLTNVAPAAHAVRISVGVNAPGMNGQALGHRRVDERDVQRGATAKSAPARRAASSWPRRRIVPAPTRNGPSDRPARHAANGREVGLGRRGVERDLEGPRPGIGQLADEVEQRGLGLDAPQHDDQPVAADGGGDRAESQRVEGHGSPFLAGGELHRLQQRPVERQVLSQGIAAHGARHRLRGSGQRRRGARRLAHRHAGRHRAGGRVGVVGRREAAPGDQEPLDAAPAAARR